MSSTTITASDARAAAPGTLAAISPERKTVRPHPEIPMTRVLIVENDQSSRRLLSTFFETDRYETIEAASVREAKRALASRQVDVVFATPELPDGNLLAALSAARDADPALSVVLVGDSASRASAPEALPAGALEVMTKPLHP